LKTKINIQQILYIIVLTTFIAITYGFGKYIFSTITPNIVSDLGLSYEFVGIMNTLATISVQRARCEAVELKK